MQILNNHWMYLMHIALTHHQIIWVCTNNNNNHSNNERTCIFLWTLERRMVAQLNERGWLSTSVNIGT
uniref:Uncharacterized protein n=1 Tax=Glossina morsitans morsitans TaxID=37546 RepID=A0A1B0FH36_GLOMM